MLTKHGDGSDSSIGLIGFRKHLYAGEDLCIGRDCDVSVLEDCNETEIELPVDFVKFIDENF
jgi:hypothetical protein